MSIRVVLADDHPVVRHGLGALLGAVEGIEVVAIAADGDEAVQAAVEYAPDVLVIDIHMPGASGFEVIAEAKEGHALPPLVFVTAHSEHALQAFESEALDYLLKPVTRERLQQTLRRLRNGEAPQNPAGGTAASMETRSAPKVGEGFLLLDPRRPTHLETAEGLLTARVPGHPAPPPRPPAADASGRPDPATSSIHRRTSRARRTCWS